MRRTRVQIRRRFQAHAQQPFAHPPSLKLSLMCGTVCLSPRPGAFHEARHIWRVCVCVSQSVEFLDFVVENGAGRAWLLPTISVNPWYVSGPLRGAAPPPSPELLGCYWTRYPPAPRAFPPERSTSGGTTGGLLEMFASRRVLEAPTQSEDLSTVNQKSRAPRFPFDVNDVRLAKPPTIQRQRPMLMSTASQASDVRQRYSAASSARVRIT